MHQNTFSHSRLQNKSLNGNGSSDLCASFFREMRGHGVLIGPQEHHIWRTELEAELDLFWPVTPIIDIYVDKGVEISLFLFRYPWFCFELCIQAQGANKVSSMLFCVC